MSRKLNATSEIALYQLQIFSIELSDTKSQQSVPENLKQDFWSCIRAQTCEFANQSIKNQYARIGVNAITISIAICMCRFAMKLFQINQLPGNNRTSPSISNSKDAYIAVSPQKYQPIHFFLPKIQRTKTFYFLRIVWLDFTQHKVTLVTNFHCSFTSQRTGNCRREKAAFS